MNIGFDAKRAFHNKTGLGNYSRLLINGMLAFYPEFIYYLYNPKKSSAFNFDKKLIEINPTAFYDTLLPALWRSFSMKYSFENKIDIFHGLSNELPMGSLPKKTKYVVSIHDLIFEHYPTQYSKMDRLIYRKKFKHACEKSDIIIAISEATKHDLETIYTIASDKIKVCYQCCDERFFIQDDIFNTSSILNTYKLTMPYFIYVGSIIERKGLLNICKALYALNHKEICLVVVGKGHNEYKQKVLHFIAEKKLSSRVLFLEDEYDSSSIFNDLPFLYNGALALIYPSVIEGFGIPILEAMASGTAVITSNCSSLQEVAGNASLLINPNDVESITHAMQQIIDSNELRSNLILKGNERLQLFTKRNAIDSIMNIYKKLV